MAWETKTEVLALSYCCSLDLLRASSSNPGAGSSGPPPSSSRKGLTAYLAPTVRTCLHWPLSVQVDLSSEGGSSVDGHKRKYIEGSIDQASNHLDDARRHLETKCRASNCIQAAQQCIELSVKAILNLLNVPFKPAHEWNYKQIEDIAKDITSRGLPARLASQGLDYTIPLPRLVRVLLSMWSQFYLDAKYGIEASHLATAQDLFRQREAGLFRG
jgi:hypothetical protein